MYIFYIVPIDFCKVDVIQIFPELDLCTRDHVASNIGNSKLLYNNKNGKYVVLYINHYLNDHESLKSCVICKVFYYNRSLLIFQVFR